MPIIVKLFAICKNLISSIFIRYFVVKKGQNTEGVSACFMIQKKPYYLTYCGGCYDEFCYLDAKSQNPS